MKSASVINSLRNKSILVTGSTGYLAKLFVEKILRVQPNVKKLYLLIRAVDANAAKLRMQDESASVINSLRNKSILVTGSTGYLAKLFVEKILRVQPNVKKLYLLIRAVDANAAKLRMQDEIVGKEVFRVLREKYGVEFDSFISSKVTPLPGDVVYENFGLQDTEIMEELLNETNIIANVAANTKFVERYDVLLSTNTFGPKTVAEFAKKCVTLEMLLHVSTAYVCGERSGLILEKPFEMGESLNGTVGLDIQQELRLVNQTLKELQTMKATREKELQVIKELGMKRAKFYGWPNTYVFTKAMGEMLIGHTRGNQPLVIIHPTVVTSTYREPFPGWIEGARHIDILTLAYGKGKLSCFLGDPALVLDLIPGDMVVNAMIVGMVVHANQSSEFVYQVGSSLKNPINPLAFVDYTYKYFCKNPVLGKDGNHVMVKRLRILTSMMSFHGYMALRYILPLKMFGLVNALCCNYFHQHCNDMNQKARLVMSLVELYAPYIYFKGIFDDLNTEKLRISLVSNKTDAETFYFDPKYIDWKAYFSTVHLPGVVRHNLKYQCP